MFKMFKKNNKETKNLYKVTYKFIDEEEVYTMVTDVLTYICSDWDVEVISIEKA